MKKRTKKLSKTFAKVSRLLGEAKELAEVLAADAARAEKVMAAKKAPKTKKTKKEVNDNGKESE